MAEDSKVQRKEQPKCGSGRKSGCAHPISFHGGGTSECKALGCSCKKWVKPLKAKPEVVPA